MASTQTFTVLIGDKVEIFEPLRAPEFFRRVELNQEKGTIEWPNGADFAPEFLHEIGKEVKQVACI